MRCVPIIHCDSTTGTFRDIATPTVFDFVFYRPQKLTGVVSVQGLKILVQACRIRGCNCHACNLAYFYFIRGLKFRKCVIGIDDPSNFQISQNMIKFYEVPKIRMYRLLITAI